LAEIAGRLPNTPVTIHVEPKEDGDAWEAEHVES
jgi:hypothetical protein